MRLRETQRQWQARQSADLPPTVTAFLEEGHAARFDPTGQTIPRAPESSSPWYVPNQWLIAVTRQLRKAKLWKAFNEEVIHTQAQSAARLCSRMKEFTRRCEFARSSGVTPPEVKGRITETGASARLGDPMWWRRQFRKVWTRSAECGLRELGMIRRGRECYASDSAVFFRKSMKRRMDGFIKRHRLLSAEGEILELAPVVAASLANPELRRKEMMARNRGLEELSQHYKHNWMFATLTCPSAFHPQLSAGGANPKYNGSTVREAQAWLCKMWARARAQLKKKKVLYYGFRTVEPHHDGTPHWHVLFYGSLQALGVLTRVVQRLWLSEFRDEAGAQAHRAKFEMGDPSKGSAVGYIAKYIAKNVDGAGAIGPGLDLETGTPVHAGVIRVETWARLHGIRQFQQIGGPSIGLYRELRRIREEEEIKDPDIWACWERANRGNYCGFVLAVGGIEAGRRSALRLEKIDQHHKNRYGEEKGPCVVGVRYCGAVHITRTTEWKVIPCGSTLPPWAFSSWEPDSASTSATGSPAMTKKSPTSGPQVPWILRVFRDGLDPTRPRKPIERHPVIQAWADQVTVADVKAEERMWALLRLRSRSGSSLGPVAITVTAPRQDPGATGSEKDPDSS